MTPPGEDNRGNIICQQTGKVCMNRRDAQGLLNRLRRRQNRRPCTNKIPSRVYQCPHCNRFHLTSKKHPD